MTVTRKESPLGKYQWFIEKAKVTQDKAIALINKHELQHGEKRKSGQYLITEWK